MFPLIARPGGVLTRSGHTEAATDLARLAKLDAVGVLAEVVNDDGTVKRLPQLLEFAQAHGLKIVTIEDLIQYRFRTEKFIDLVGEKQVVIGGTPVTIQAYRTPFDAMQHIVAIVGEVYDGKDVPCRIHREQPIVDLLARAGQSRSWLDVALAQLREHGRGILILLRNPLAEDPVREEETAGRAEPVDGRIGVRALRPDDGELVPARRRDDLGDARHDLGAGADVEPEPREVPLVVAEVVLEVDDEQHGAARVELEPLPVVGCHAGGRQVLHVVVFTNAGEYRSW